jgi:hypothetical protein
MLTHYRASELCVAVRRILKRPLFLVGEKCRECDFKILVVQPYLLGHAVVHAALLVWMHRAEHFDFARPLLLLGIVGAGVFCEGIDRSYRARGLKITRLSAAQDLSRGDQMYARLFVATVMLTSTLSCLAQEGKVRSSNDGLKKKIIGYEMAGWDQAKRKDSKALASDIANDALMVGGYGIWGKKRESAIPGSQVNSAPLRCDGAKELMDQPVVEADIAGVHVCVIVDTGASDTVLDDTLHDPSQRLQQEGGNDVGGTAVDAELARNVPLRIGDLTATLPTVAFTKIDPGLYQEYGVQGFLSPQHLASNTAILLDLPARRLLTFEQTSDLAAWIRRTEPGARIVRVPLRRRKGNLYLSVHVGTRPPLSMLLDTGARHTVFPFGYLQPHPAAKVHMQTGFSGLPYRYLELPDQVLVIAGNSFGPVNALTPESRPPQESPRLGIDLLGQVQMAFPRGKKVNEVWLISPEAARPR